MKMLAIKTHWSGAGWQWVQRRNPKTNTVITTPCKNHSLGAEDLEYFRDTFPQHTFLAKENLND